MEIEPFYKIGDNVKVLPMNSYMKNYSNNLYQENKVYEIQNIYPPHREDPIDSSYGFMNSYCYTIKYKRNGYDSVAYIYESMIAPANYEPLNNEYEDIYSGTKKFKVYRPIGKQGSNELYCVEQDSKLTTKFGYHLDL